MERKRLENKTGLIAVGVFVLLMVYEFVGPLILPENDGMYYYVAAVFSVVLLLVASLMTARIHKKKVGEFFSMKIFRLRWLPITLCGAGAAMLGAALINLGLSNIGLPEWMMPQVQNPFTSGVSDPIAPFLALVLVPAIFEELFIHGAALSAFRGRGELEAVLYTSLMFSMLHGSVTNLFGTFFAAVIYGYMTVVCGSVYPAMLAHLINNLLSGTIIMYGQNFFNIGYNTYFLFAAAILFLVCAFFYLGALEKYFRRHALEKPKKNGLATVPLFVPIFALLWVAKIVLSIYNIL